MKTISSPAAKTTQTIAAVVREVHHEVRLTLTNAPHLTDLTGRRRKPQGLRISYGQTTITGRVDIVVEYAREAALWLPISPVPAWLQAIVDQHRPALLDHVGDQPAPADDSPTTSPEPKATGDYKKTLAAARRVGAARADDPGLMAMFCAGPLQTLVGAVGPQLVWEGAQRAGMTSKDLAHLAATDFRAVDELQWT